MKNHFFIIGVQRCFTTWLEKTLRNCSDVEMASAIYPSQEPKYFLRPDANHIDYEKIFFKSSFADCYGDKSVSYIESSTAIKNINDIYPDGKFIICLRNPINRSLSHYFYNKLNNIESRTLEEVFLQDTPHPKNEITSMNPYFYISRSQYSTYISKFLQKNTIVVISESLPTRGIYEVCDFIGVKAPRVCGESINSSIWNVDISDQVLECIQSKLCYEKSILENLLNRKIDEWT